MSKSLTYSRILKAVDRNLISPELKSIAESYAKENANKADVHDYLRKLCKAIKTAGIMNLNGKIEERPGHTLFEEDVEEIQDVKEVKPVSIMDL